MTARLEEPALRDRLSVELPGLVRVDPASLAEFQSDRTECAAGQVAAVVRPLTVEDVARTLRVANELEVPVVPAVAGTNTGGLTIPAGGGVVLDLRGMNRIVSLDEENMLAVLEPGVGFGDLHAELERRGGRLAMGYPMAPPEASVVANCLLDGLGNLSLPHGSMAEWITGLEAVLADGTVIRAGSVGAGGSWCVRGPLPDLVGLFVGHQGTTGVVTKLGVRLWHKPRLRWRGFAFAKDRARAFAAARAIARDGTCRDCAILGWPVARMALGVPRPTRKDPGEAECLLFLEWGADEGRDLERTGERVRARLRAEGLDDPIPVDHFLAIDEGLAKFAQLPTRLDFMLDAPGGGLTWVGTYGPSSAWEEGARLAETVLVKHGLPPALVARPMREGHFGVLRFLILFDKKDPADVTRVRDAMAELVDGLAPLGFVPYKTPPWVVARMRDRIDPGYRDALERVRRALDPRGILNPGKWASPGKGSPSG